MKLLCRLIISSFVLIGLTLGSQQHDVGEQRRLRRQDSGTSTSTTSRNGLGIHAFVLNLGTTATNPSDVVMQVFRDSLVELLSPTRRTKSVSLGPISTLAEYRQAENQYQILCVPTNGNLAVEGMVTIDDPRRRQLREASSGRSFYDGGTATTERRLRNRRRDLPYYNPYTVPTPRRDGSTIPVNTLIDTMNRRAIGGFRVESLFGTDSTMCGNSGVLPLSVTPSPATIVVGIGGRSDNGSHSPSQAPISEFPTSVPSSSTQPSAIGDTEVPSLASSLVPTDLPTDLPTVESSFPPSVSFQPSLIRPTVSFQPSTSYQPSVLHQPTASYEPSISHLPTSSYQPSASPQPTLSYQPSISHQPTASYQPSVSRQPTVSDQPSVSRQPTVSDQPSISTSPSLPPPDWEQFGNTIRGSSVSKIVMSNDGTVVGTILSECAATNPTPCGRLYSNENLGLWMNMGTPIFAPTNMSLVDLSLSGDGSHMAFLSTKDSADSDGNQARHVEVFTVSEPTHLIVGDAVEDTISFDTSGTSSVCVEGDLLATNMGNGKRSFLQAYQWSGTVWAKLGQPLATEYGEAAVEFSGDCRTVVITDAVTRSYIWTLSAQGQWTSNEAGFPETKFASVVMDGTGSTIATRSFSEDGFIDIYKSEKNIWQKTYSVFNSQVYESNFGYKLDLSADGTTVAIATFRRTSSSTVTCTQAFQFNSTDWAPLGRPPCLSFQQGHAGFGSYLALSGDGGTMAVGDIGIFSNPNDR